MKILIFLLLIVSTINISALDTKANVPNNENYDWLDNRIGFTYSMMTGYGLTYLRQLNEDFAIKSQLFAYGTIEENTEYLEIILSLGAELQYNIRKYDRTRLYGLVGGYYDYLKEAAILYSENDYFYTENSFNFGAGIGFEILFKYNLSLSIDGGYFVNFTDIKDYDILYIPGQNDGIIAKNTKPIRFGFAFGASIYYNF